MDLNSRKNKRNISLARDAILFADANSDISGLRRMRYDINPPTGTPKTRQARFGEPLSRPQAYRSPQANFARGAYIANPRSGFISRKKKRTAAQSFSFLGVTGFEPAASWSRTKRSTELSHTPKNRPPHADFIILSHTADRVNSKKRFFPGRRFFAARSLSLHFRSASPITGGGINPRHSPQKKNRSVP